MDLTNLLGSIASGNPLSLLSAIPKGAQEQVSNLLGGSLNNIANASPQVLNNVNSVIENSSPVLADTVKSVNTIYILRNVIIVFLLLWGIGLILTQVLVQNQKVKDDLEYANTLFLGNLGIIPIVVLIYVSSLLIVTLIPVIISISPKLDQLITSANTVVSTFAGH